MVKVVRALCFQNNNLRDYESKIVCYNCTRKLIYIFQKDTKYCRTYLVPIMFS